MGSFEITSAFQFDFGHYCLVLPRIEVPAGNLLIVTGDSRCRIDEVLRFIAGKSQSAIIDRPDPGTVRATSRRMDFSKTPIRLDNASVFSSDASRRIGYANCDPDSLLGRTVLEEYLMSLTSRDSDGGRSGTHILARSGLRAVGLAELADRRVTTLSAGERQRLGIASALAGPPDVVVFDLSSNNLDDKFRAEIPGILSALVAQNVIVVVGILADEALTMPAAYRTLVGESSGKTVKFSCNSEAANPTHRTVAPAPAARKLGDEIVRVQGLERRDRVVAAATFSVCERELICVSGPNGVGKTSLAESLAGYVHESKIKAQNLWRKRGLCMGIAAQFPDVGVLGRTPWSELPDSALLEVIDLQGYATTPVDQLTYAQRKLLSCASAAYHSRGAVIFDEPTAGLDAVDMGRLVGIIDGFPNLAFLMISHDPNLATFSRVVRLGSGVH